MSSLLEELYRTVIIEHSRNPHHFGKLEDPDLEASGSNPLCGDELHVELKIGDDGTVTEIGFTGHGCAISQSSASLMTDAVKTATDEEALELMERFVAMVKSAPDSETDSELGELQAMAGVRRFPARVKCATLAWHTLEAALTNKSAQTRDDNTC